MSSARSSRLLAIRLRRSAPQRRASEPGFTLLELSIVIFIMALIFTIAMPYMGSYRKARLKSEARRLAGRASYLYDEASAQKVFLRLVFDLDHQVYGVLRLDPYSTSTNPTFTPDHSMAGAQVVMPPSVAIRDVTVGDLGTFSAGTVSCQFYPEGYVDATLVHMIDLSGHVMTLVFNPVTGRVSIADGDLSMAQVLIQ
ncbi:MAG: Tfp pilus assembly protein FimT/FimU [Candidatus Binataceae bacterium]